MQTMWSALTQSTGAIVPKRRVWLPTQCKTSNRSSSCLALRTSMSAWLNLRRDELCLLLFAGRERLLQLRTVSPLAALDLGELIDQRPPTAVQVVHDGFALRVETQAC